MISKKKNLSAFTLIELLIIVFIVSILSTVIIVSFRDNRLRKEVELAAREVGVAFRAAQNYALTGSQVVSGTEPCRFALSWGGSTYTIINWYKDGSGICNQQTTFRTYTLKNGVTFANASNFYFSLPHANPSFAGTSVNAQVTKSGSTYAVCVYSTGRIEEVSGSACP